MSDVRVGIFHKDKRYGTRLMEYLNHQKEYPMIAWYTEDENKIKDRQDEFSCLILAEDMPYQGTRPVCLLKEKEYLPANDIAGEIYGLLQVSTRAKEKLVGIYSPFGNLVITDVALEYARRNGSYYFGMEPFSKIEANGEIMEELLVRIKDGRADGMYFKEHVQAFCGTKGYGKANCYFDYLVPTVANYNSFFQKLKADDIFLVVDLGTNTIPGFGFFQMFDQIYIILHEMEAKRKEYEEFKKQMKHFSKVPRERMKEILLPKDMEGKEIVDLL